MKLYEKISLIRKEKKLKIRQLHNRIKQTFGKKAISYRSLLRIEKGCTDGRASSLYQICSGLGTTLRELEEGTDKEFGIAEYINRNRREGRYTYNQKCFAEILTGPVRKFLALELTLEPGGKTNIEKDPETGEKFEKWVYVLKGKVTCIVRNVKYTLDKGDCLSFDSSITHSIENNTSARACCIVIQDPRHI